MFVPAAIRNISVGTDTKTYIEIFYSIRKGVSWHEQRYEPLYLALIKFIDFLGLNHRGMLVIFSFLTYLFVFLSATRKYLYLIVPIYILIAYPYSMSVLRQGLAITIAMYALRLFLERKYIKTIIWILISAGFHVSGMVYLPLFLLFYFFKLKTKYAIPIAIIASVLTSYVFTAQFIIENVASILGFNNMKITETYNYTAKGSGLGAFARRILMAIPVIYLALSKIKNDNMLKNIVLVTFPLLIIANLYQIQSHIFNRLVMIFWFVYGMIFVCICQIGSRYRKIVISLILCGWFTLFVIDLERDAGRKDGAFNVIPYRTMFQN